MAGIEKLTDKSIKSAKPADKEYTQGDGGNLFIRIRPKGAKNWIFIYSHPQTKKRSKLGLGVYPDTSLTYARKLAREYRSQLAKGVDPKIYREKLIHDNKEKHENTFYVIAEEFLALQEKKEVQKRQTLIESYRAHALKEKKTFDDIDIAKIEQRFNTSHNKRLFLKRNLYPALANMPIQDITVRVAIAAIKPLEAAGKLESVKRGCTYLKQIMNFAVLNAYIQGNCLICIQDAFIKPASKPMPTVEPEDLTKVMAIMSNTNMKIVTRCAFEMQIHTLTRASELSSMRWSDIDFDNKQWVIPSFDTKMVREHKIPLSSYALGILQFIKPISGQDKYVFPSDKLGSKFPHISPGAVNSAMQATPLKGELVSHGLRSIGSTKLNEEDFNADAIEVALSHLDKDRVRASYNNAQYMDQRREIMQFWSEFIVESTGKYYSVAGQYKPDS